MREQGNSAAPSGWLLDQHISASDLIRQLPDIVFVIDADERIVDCNEHPDMLAPRAQLLGRRLGDFVPEKLAERSCHALRTTLSTGIEAQFDYHLPIRQQMARFEARVRKLGDALALVVVRNITHRDELSRLSQVASQTTNGVVITDLDGQTQWINEGFTRMTGYALSDMMGKRPGDLLQGRDSDPEVIATMRAAIDRRDPFEVDIVNYSRDGHAYWVHISCNPVYDSEGCLQGFMAIESDITQQKEFEAALRASEQRLSYLMGASPVAIYACSAESPFGATFVTANVEAMTGWSASAFLADPSFWLDHVHPDDRERALASVARALETGDGQFEYRFQRSDGSHIWLSDSVRMVRHADHRSAELVGSWLDISEQKRIDGLKREFVSTVSHELRTPLTAISGALGLVTGGVVDADSGELREIVEVAYENSLRLTALINDLLDIEKLAAGKMRFDIKRQPLLPIIVDALRENQAYADRFGVRLEKLAHGPDVEVSVDAGRLRQVMANLLSNAVKFSPSGGCVEVDVSLEGHGVRIAVTDHGPGVPAAFKERIFQRFSQADGSDARRQGGTGLGLAISRELLEHMGGRIGFDSEEGGGATFHVHLPCLPSYSGEVG